MEHRPVKGHLVLKVCRIMACSAPFPAVGPLFYIVLGPGGAEPQMSHSP